MARGNKIVISPDPQGIKLEGTVVGTPSPGTCMEMDPTVSSLVNGRLSYRVFQPGGDGIRKLVIVCNVNPFNGMLATTAYANGDHGFFYVPQAGEELNMLLLDIAGTGDVHNIGDTLAIQNATGKLITLAGTDQSSPFQLLEAVTPTADFLAWCVYTGY